MVTFRFLKTSTAQEPTAHRVGFLKVWKLGGIKVNWGPIGIRLGMGNQEVSWNEIRNYHSMGGEWGGDGGAIEIDDGR